MSSPNNPTIDERIAALTMNLELAERQRVAWEEKVRKLDARERRARQALLMGISTFLEVLNQEPNEDDAG